MYEAISRLITPVAVDGRTMFIVAALGIVVNCIMGYAAQPTSKTRFFVRLLCVRRGILHQSGGHSHGLGGAHAHAHSHGHSHTHAHDDDACSKSPTTEDGHHSSSDVNSDAKTKNHVFDKRNINVRSAFVHVLGGM